MLLEQLQQQKHFSPIEHDIAEYILTNGEAICQMSIQSLANNTYSSPSTIMRFCKNLGTHGFSDFKIKLKEEFVKKEGNIVIENLNFPFYADDSYKTIANKLSKLTQQSIETTLSLMDYNTITRIINKLKTVIIIDIYGQGSSLAAAFEFKTKMIRLGMPVHLEQDFSDQIYQAITSNEKHFSIVISHSGETEETLKITRALKHTNTTILGISNEPGSPISNLCDYNIYTGVNETKFLSSKTETFGSTISVQYILNCLHMFIYLSDFDNNFNKAKKNEKVLNEKQNNI